MYGEPAANRNERQRFPACPIYDLDGLCFRFGCKYLLGIQPIDDQVLGFKKGWQKKLVRE